MASKKDNELIIYWAPNPFVITDDSWNLLYTNPKPVLDKLMKQEDHSDKGTMRMCPAVKDMFRNTFTFTSAVNDQFTFDIDFAKHYAKDKKEMLVIPCDNNKVAFCKTRPSSFEGYIDVDYNMSWIFFAEESVTAKFTAPYFPTSTPAKGAIYAAGKYDIGRWFRPILTNLHVPLTTDKFGYNKGDEIFYMEVMTEKKVKFKRFNMDSALCQLRDECANHPIRVEQRLSLETRYAMADDSDLRGRVLREIKKNLAT